LKQIGALVFAYAVFSTALSGSATASVTGSGAERLGTSLVALPDMSSPPDGKQEVAVGAPRATTPGSPSLSEAGAVYVFLGRSGFDAQQLAAQTDANLIIRGATSFGHFGESIGSTDWDGNAVPDLVIGEPDNGAGRTYIFPDSLILARIATSQPGQPAVLRVDETGVGIESLSGENPGDRFGAAVSRRHSDIDGDGLGDIVVGAPSHGGGRTVFYDGFDDGEWSLGPAWTSHTGHLKIEGSGTDLRQTQGGEESISTPSDLAFGSWETRFKHGVNSASNSILRFYFLGVDGAFGPASSNARGYYLFVNTAFSPDLIRLIRDDGTGTFVLASTQISVGTGYNELKVTRYLNGHFHVFLNGAWILEATDTMYNSAKFMGLRNSADTSSATVFVDWVRASELTSETLFDDFSDENLDLFPTWTRPSGTWTSSSGVLEATSVGVASISTPAQTGVGTWSLKFRHESDVEGVNSIVRFYPFFGGTTDPGATTLVQGYYLFSNTWGNQLKFFRQQGSTVTTLVSTTWDDDTNWHEMKVYRDSDGYWQFYLDGYFVADVTDAVIPFGSGKNIGFRNSADTTTANVQLDDVRAPKGLTGYGAAYVFLSSETLSKRTAGSADMVRYGDQDGDHYGTSVSTTAGGDVVIGAPDADFCCKAPDSGLVDYIQAESILDIGYLDDFDGSRQGEYYGEWSPPPDVTTEWELGVPLSTPSLPDNPQGDHTTGLGNAWGTDLDNFYNTATGDMDLLSVTVNLSTFQTAQLLLWHAYWVEGGYDFIKVQGTFDGENFTDLYSATDHSPIDSASGRISWVRLSIGLENYVGGLVQFKFRLDQDALVVANGWYLDDVKISGTKLLPSARFKGTNGEGFGFSLDSGDVNGDGIEDLAVGAPKWVPPGSPTSNVEQGRAYILYAKDDPTLMGIDLTYTGENTGDRFGHSISAQGDLNGDLFTEVAIGAPGFDVTPGTNNGKVYVFGSSPLASGLLTASDAVRSYSTTSGAQGGTAVEFGNVNGGLFDELLFGAPFDQAGGLQSGLVGFNSDPDSDGDGLPDYVENLFTLGESEIDWDTDRAIDLNTNPADPDTDDDGLNDGFEVGGQTIVINGIATIVSSNPLLRDTDKDTIPDNVEVMNGMNPNSHDTDSDGIGDNPEFLTGFSSLVNNQPVTFFSNPREAHSDSDDVIDGKEWESKTNPQNSDTDGDGFSDADELFGSIVGINQGFERLILNSPLRSEQSGPILFAPPPVLNSDSDGDGLLDTEEQTGWSVRRDLNSDGFINPNDPNEVFTRTSDYTDSDTDNDGVDDGNEFQQSMDPAGDDTDQDGLKDHEELFGGKFINLSLKSGIPNALFLARSDPHYPDSDGDGLSDVSELTGSEEEIQPLVSLICGVCSDQTYTVTFAQPGIYRLVIVLEWLPFAPTLTVPIISEASVVGKLDGSNVRTWQVGGIRNPSVGVVLGITQSQVGSHTLTLSASQFNVDESYQVEEIFVRKPETAPLKMDSDEDGLTDPQEILLKTDPTDFDSDDDSLEDGSETRGVSVNDPSTYGPGFQEVEKTVDLFGDVNLVAVSLDAQGITATPDLEICFVRPSPFQTSCHLYVPPPPGDTGADCLDQSTYSTSAAAGPSWTLDFFEKFRLGGEVTSIKFRGTFLALFNIVIYKGITAADKFDTDVDGAGDGFEVNNDILVAPGVEGCWLDPTDPNDAGLITDDCDGDGLPNSLEDAIGSLKCSAHSDSDGIPDGIEFYGFQQTVGGALLPFTSNPILPNSDSDSLLDNREWEIGTNPKDPDTDDDLLTDGEEDTLYHTELLHPDIDLDGLLDSEEVKLGLDFFITDPENNDTDDDGLNDWEAMPEPVHVVVCSTSCPYNPVTIGPGGSRVVTFGLTSLGYYAIDIQADSVGPDNSLVQVIVDGKQMRPLEFTTTTSFKAALVGLREGGHWIELRVLDKSGHEPVSGVNIRYVQVDKLDGTPIKLDPTKGDTDGDVLSDDEELEGWEVLAVTSLESVEKLAAALADPNDADDPDGYIDSWYAWSSPGSSDTDGDQLDDVSESLLFSDPTSTDTDTDTLTDYEDDFHDDPTVFDITPPDITVNLVEKPPWTWHVNYDITVFDPAGIKSFEIHINGEDAVCSQPGGGSDSQRFTGSCTLPASVVFSPGKVSILAEDMHGNVAETLALQLNTLLNHIAGVAARAFAQFPAPFGPFQGGSVGGFLHSVEDTFASLVQLITSLPRIYEMGSDLWTAAAALDTSKFGQMLDGIADFFRGRIDGINPFCCGNTQNPDAGKATTFAAGYVSGYIGGLILQFVLTGGGQGAGILTKILGKVKDAIAKFTTLATKVLPILNKFSELAGKFAQIIAKLPLPNSKIAKKIILYAIAITSAYALSMAFPETFGRWIASGFGLAFTAVMAKSTLELPGLTNAERKLAYEAVSEMTENTGKRARGAFCPALVAAGCPPTFYKKADFIKMYRDLLAKGLKDSAENLRMAIKKLSDPDVVPPGSILEGQLRAQMAKLGGTYKLMVKKAFADWSKAIFGGRAFELEMISRFKELGNKLHSVGDVIEVQVKNRWGKLVAKKLDSDVITEVVEAGVTKRVTNELKAPVLVLKLTSNIKLQLRKMAAAVDNFVDNGLHFGRLIVKGGKVTRDLWDYIKNELPKEFPGVRIDIVDENLVLIPRPP
jgi:hypothetical protein